MADAVDRHAAGRARCSRRHPTCSAATSSRAAATRRCSRPPSSCSRRCSPATSPAFRVLEAEGVAGRRRRRALARRVRRARRGRGARRSPTRCGSWPSRPRDAGGGRGAARDDDARCSASAPTDAAALCDEARGDDVLLVANENSPQQVVISGSVAGDRTRRGARGRAEDPRGAAERRRRVPLAADGAGRRAARGAIDAASRSRRRAFPVAVERHGRARRRRPRSCARSLERHVVSPVRWERRARRLCRTPAPTRSSRPGPATS